MGNKIQNMSICRREQSSTHKLSDFSSFTTLPSKLNDSERADRDSLIENAESVSIDDFNLLKVLGSGAFGKVFLVEKKNKIPGKKNKLYAMKALRKDFIISNNQIAHTMTERRILEEINSPFIVKLAYAFQSDDKLYLVMEYVQGGELFFHLRQRGKFTEE